MRAIIEVPIVQKWALVTSSSSYINVQSRLGKKLADKQKV
jgi:hypothetical protein